MKKKLLTMFIVTTVISCTIYKINGQSSQKKFSDISLANIEALASGENSNGEDEKKYRYQVWQNDECWIYVGGAYAKGKKISCYSGKDHPKCADCSL